MKEIEFTVPHDADLTQAVKLIEKICAQYDLILAMKGSLAAYPGCVHWHYKRQNQKGTLELTLFARDRRVWAKVQDGRKAPWIDEDLPALQWAIERAIAGGRIVNDCPTFPISLTAKARAHTLAEDNLAGSG